MPAVLECRTKPSAFKVSSAYSISTPAATISGRGREAKKPKWVGSWRLISAAYSFVCLVRDLVNSMSDVKSVPGEEILRMDLAVPIAFI